ncbi:hypothetical protein MKY84_03380 [Chryseomicrobium sp. FSL W7-1435]|uniref:HAAS signaling domain-containing protein n=1 Tax=Chryseomicrobium sp. FSL W7-1435 TaxID=2921704 RepID=UPI00315A643D
MMYRDAYIAEVTRRLPQTMREDVALELESTIADMTSDTPSQEELFEALRQLGDPVLLASRYLERPLHLIGPALYPTFISILKIVLPIALIVSGLTALLGVIVDFSEEFSWGQGIIQGILQIVGSMLAAGIQSVFWVGLVFALIERYSSSRDTIPLSKWDPSQLKPVTLKKRQISRASLIGGFVWTAIWVGIYLNASNLIRLYWEDQSLPLLNEEALRFFLPAVIALAAVEVGFGIYKWVKGFWTIPMAFWNLVFNLFWIIGTVLFLTHPELFSQEALTQFGELLGQTTAETESLKRWAVWTLLISFIVIATTDVVDGFMKTRVPRHQKK